MYSLALTLVIILSALIVITIMMQPSKQNSAADVSAGGADKLFGKQEAHGFEAVIQCSAAVLGTIWMILLSVLAFLPSK